jgi:hypothetical protein
VLSQFGVGHAPVALKEFQNLCVDWVDAGHGKTLLISFIILGVSAQNNHHMGQNGKVISPQLDNFLSNSPYNRKTLP